MKGACVNCKYHVTSQTAPHLCSHPNFFDPVTGEAVVACRVVRGVPTILSYLNGFCGRDGRFFIKMEASND